MDEHNLTPVQCSGLYKLLCISVFPVAILARFMRKVFLNRWNLNSNRCSHWLVRKIIFIYLSCLRAVYVCLHTVLSTFYTYMRTKKDQWIKSKNILQIYIKNFDGERRRLTLNLHDDMREVVLLCSCELANKKNAQHLTINFLLKINFPWKITGKHT